ncbi:MAG: HD domain-containing protein [Clostridiales bacterium]|nr:HD domain-containing protein [Clostridiales bacterium]
MRRRPKKDLAERSKEISALYRVIEIAEMPGLTFDTFISVLQQVLPEGFQFPDAVCTRIVLNGNEYKSGGFKETEWVLSAPLTLHNSAAGHIDVLYKKVEKTNEDDGPFLREERSLLNAIAKVAGRIIERIQLDQELLVKNLAFDTSISANSICNTEGEVIEVNKEAAQLWGYEDQKEIIGKHISIFFGDPDVSVTVLDTLKVQGRWKGKFSARRKDGSSFVAYALAGKITDGNGDPMCYQSSVIDISDQINLQNELIGRLQFETLSAKLAARFINVSSDLLDDEIKDAQRQICDHLGIDLSTIYEPSQSEDKRLELRFLYAKKADPPVPEDFAAVRYFPWCEKQLLSGKTVVVSTMDRLPPEASVDKESWSHYGIKSSLIFPLTSVGDQTLGTVSFDMRKEERIWSDEVIQQLRAFAQIFANALARKHFVTELIRYKEELESSNKKLLNRLQQSINAISKIGETRDSYTAGHQKRVKQIACAIAEEMGLPAETIDNIAFGALVHDIGKIYIASEILNKPAIISDIEYRILQTHVKHSYDVVKEIDFPRQIPTMVYQHHERLDGTGYPEGISGDEIIIESRILAVADVVDAISSDRPYQPALGLDAAVEEITRYRGTRYDADVVDAFMRLLKGNKPELGASR